MCGAIVICRRATRRCYHRICSPYDSVAIAVTSTVEAAATNGKKEDEKHLQVQADMLEVH